MKNSDTVMTSRDRQVLDAMLRHDFVDRAQIAGAIREAAFVELSDKTGYDIRYDGKYRNKYDCIIPVEATIEDKDGVPIIYLLHIVNNVPSELEIFKADGSAILDLEGIRNLKVDFVLRDYQMPRLR